MASLLHQLLFGMENLSKYETELKHSFSSDISSSEDPRQDTFIKSVQCPLDHSSRRPFKQEIESRWWTQKQLGFHLSGYHGMRTADASKLVHSTFASARQKKVARIERQKLWNLAEQKSRMTLVDPAILEFLKPKKRVENPLFLQQVKQRIERARQRNLKQMM